jgi:hypothetical protein
MPASQSTSRGHIANEQSRINTSSGGSSHPAAIGCGLYRHKSANSGQSTSASKRSSKTGAFPYSAGMFEISHSRIVIIIFYNSKYPRRMIYRGAICHIEVITAVCEWQLWVQAG